MTRAGAIDRIDALLSSVSDPTFAAVMRGEPLAVSGTPLCAFWITTRATTQLTLRDASTLTTFLVRIYFRMQVSADVRESIELDLWDASVNIDTALRSDANLAGHCSDSNVGTSTTGYTSIGGISYRTLDIPFEVEILGEVTITP